MAYVIDEKVIRITDRHTNSYFIKLNKISFMIFKKDNLCIYLDGRELKFDAKDYIHADELRRMYYSLLTTFTAPSVSPLTFRPSAPINISTTTRNYGKIPSRVTPRPLAMAQGSSAKKGSATEDSGSDPEENIVLLRSSKKPTQ